ncbi:MAG TPA: 4-alpha-glucanotransferase [Polyangia bacterium]|nr:4-alpha-glucanotransferase [Polyangia bacterium]
MAALGIQRLVLAIHDQSFPSEPDEDLGRGSPYGRGGRRLLAFIRELGFNGVQLGPQGDTTLVNPSPYDGAQWTRSPSSIALGTLLDGDDGEWRRLADGLLAPAVETRPAGPPDRVQYAHAWHATRTILAQLHDRFRAAPERTPALATRFAQFRAAHGAALAPDSEFEALTAEHATDEWRRWPAIDRDLWSPPPGAAGAVAERRAALHAARAREIERHQFGQFLLGEQHRAWRAAAAAPPAVALFGDLQIGFSHRDVWSRRALFRRDYLMGAPPSRTNPAGQAWGYPVLDPERYRNADGSAGPVLQLVLGRVARMLDDFDGLRVDHPHGLICPWVYDAADPDPAAAVGRGARLFESPDLPDHPRLAPLAIPTRAQLSADPGIARYADDWVRELTDAQVDRYGVLFDGMMAQVRAAGRSVADVICEVLSTWPYPLRRVMQRHGLGRFRVTQKANLTRADDVYRAENAAPNDWIMAGNHDTPPVWALARQWRGTATEAAWAAHLAQALMPDGTLRPRLARWLAADPRHLCQGLFAELFASRAQRVSVFFADLFGIEQVYNRPGLVSDENWSLRLPSDFQALYRTRVATGAAFDVPLALALACAARAPADPGLRAVGRQLLGALGVQDAAGPGGIVPILESAL